MIVYLYFGKKYIILAFNDYLEKINYKHYNENIVLKKIIKYCKNNYIEFLTVVSNRIYCNINNLYDKNVKIQWKNEPKDMVKNRIEIVRIYNILLDNNLL